VCCNVVMCVVVMVREGEGNGKGYRKGFCVL
jgi:hypothetical protein